MNPKKPFRNVNLPRVLVDEIEKIIKEPIISHHTIASFVEYAVRKHIDKAKEDIILERQHQEHMEAMGLK